MEVDSDSSKRPKHDVDREFLKVSVEGSFNKPTKVEICQSSKSKAKRDDLEEAVTKYLVGQPVSPLAETVHSSFEDSYLAQNVEHVTVSAVDSSSGIFEETLLDSVEFCTYQMQDERPFSEELEEEVTAAQTWMLPSKQLHGLWASLYYEDDLKENLLEYMRTTLLFSDNNVNPDVITWNRLILLHGPPGTGKTSLCRALAHKLSIALGGRYKFSQLLEINSHSLFSKWFSESGKLVLKMFQKIEEIVSNPQVLVFVLIDEVESLTSSRQFMSSNEPTESIRVVNALLTQLDFIKRHPNILVLATSNMTSMIDSAFLDRADIRQYVGLPGRFGVYEILRTCIDELVRVGIITCLEEVLLERQLLQVLLRTDEFQLGRHPCTLQLLRIAESCEGLSGRTLRKLPFLAHALHIQRPSTSLKEFSSALKKAVEKHLEDEKKNGTGNSCN